MSLKILSHPLLNYMDNVRGSRILLEYFLHPWLDKHARHINEDDDIDHSIWLQVLGIKWGLNSRLTMNKWERNKECAWIYLERDRNIDNQKEGKNHTCMKTNIIYGWK